MSILNQLLGRQQQDQAPQQQGAGQDDILSKLAILSELMKFSRPQQQPQPVPQMEAQQPIEFESSTDVLSKLVNMGNAEKQEARLGRQEGRAIQQEGREAEEFETDKTTKADTQAAAREIYGLPQEQKGDWQSWQGIINKYPGADVNTFRQGFESNITKDREATRFEREGTKFKQKQTEFRQDQEKYRQTEANKQAMDMITEGNAYDDPDAMQEIIDETGAESSVIEATLTQRYFDQNKVTAKDQLKFKAATASVTGIDKKLENAMQMDDGRWVNTKTGQPIAYARYIRQRDAAVKIMNDITDPKEKETQQKADFGSFVNSVESAGGIKTQEKYDEVLEAVNNEPPKERLKMTGYLKKNYPEFAKGKVETKVATPKPKPKPKVKATVKSSRAPISASERGLSQGTIGDYVSGKLSPAARDKLRKTKEENLGLLEKLSQINILPRKPGTLGAALFGDR